VRFPASVVEDALRHVPSRVVLCSRDGEPSLYLEGRRSYYGTGSDLPFTRDIETGQRRSSVLQDVRNAARLVDALPNLDFVMSMALPSDAPAQTADRHNFFEMTANTTKPVVFTAWDEDGLQDILDMAEIIAGSREILARSPFLVAYLEPVSPLQHAPEVLRKIFRMADYGLPFVYSSAPIDGGTAPVTLAGNLAQANAEVLSGMVIAQLYRPGTPMIWGAGCGPLDMRTLVNIYAGPETMLHCMAMSELAHHLYNVPVWGFAGCSDSKQPDVQAGVESALMTTWNALAGANLVHDVGYIESGLTCSLEMIVINDEIIGQTKRMLNGIALTQEALALDIIDEVGPGGSFLAHAHTAAHFREIWYPRVFDRRAFDAWQRRGEPDALSNARKLVQEILAKHEAVALPEEKVREMRKVMEAKG
jgi:trimethylamine--corrinoid protein Co-methyltransferase